MKIALYTKIDVTGVTGGKLTECDVIKRAHVLGYEMIKFSGWTDSDLGYAGNRGPRWAEAHENRKILQEIGDTFDQGPGTYTAPSIYQTAEGEMKKIMEPTMGTDDIFDYTQNTPFPHDDPFL